MTRRRSTTASARRVAYGTGRVLGDVRAVQTGHIARRIANRALGRLASRLIRTLTRGL